MSTSKYHRINTDTGLESLIQDVRLEVVKINDEQSQRKTNTSNNPNQAQVSTTEPKRLRRKSKPRNASVVEWTPEDIQDWCIENNLEKWCDPLVNYQGRALLALQKVLKDDSQLQNIADGHLLTVIDVVLFRCELDKLLSSSTTTDQSEPKKHTVKRRSSKGSNK